MISKIQLIYKIIKNNQKAFDICYSAENSRYFLVIKPKDKKNWMLVQQLGNVFIIDVTNDNVISDKSYLSTKSKFFTSVSSLTDYIQSFEPEIVICNVKIDSKYVAYFRYLIKLLMKVI